MYEDKKKGEKSHNVYKKEKRRDKIDKKEKKHEKNMIHKVG